MEKIVVFFIYQNPYIVKVSLETNSYFTVKSLYPFSGVEFDYFNENVNFYNEESHPTLKRCLYSNLLPYDSLKRFHYQKRLSKQPEIKSEEEIIEKRLIPLLSQLDKSFFSKVSLQNLQYNTAQYSRFKTLSFTSLEEESNEVEELEILLKIIIKQEVNHVMFFNYEDNKYTGLECNLELNLEKEEFPVDRLLQELYKWKWSAPRLNQSENPFLRDYFTDRFLNFSEMKKLSLFLHCNTDKTLFLYNNAMSTWWCSRY